MLHDEYYEGREQTFAKHLVLQTYLKRFAYIVGSKWDSITYVDCFSGPWKSQSPELKDASFSIALHELRSVQDDLFSRRGKNLKIRCYFLEKDPNNFRELEKFALNESDDKTEIRAVNNDVEHSVQDILDFISCSPGTFSFIFIDPTGWKGFGMNLIAPLLTRRPGEVLINFMTSFIKRFVESTRDADIKSFEALYGSASRLPNISKFANTRDREESIVDAYCAAVAEKGQFEIVTKTPILQPTADTIHFHLIYGTRNLKGLEVFKDTERAAVSQYEKTRTNLQIPISGNQSQGELFKSSDYASTIHTHYSFLRNMYLRDSKHSVQKYLQQYGHVTYNDIWLKVLHRYPLVWDTDLKEWILDWKENELLDIKGLRGKQKPKLGRDIKIIWLGKADGNHTSP